MGKIKQNDIPQLVTRLREGDQIAFTHLYEFFRQKIFYTSKKMCLSSEDAEEIVQEVFLIIWKNRENLKSELSFNAYLLSILKSIIIKKSKKEARKVAFEVYSITNQDNVSYETELQVDFWEIERISNSEIEKLPHTQKEVFKLKNNDHLCSAEIAEKLGISKRTVENHIYSASKTLKNILRSKYDISIKSLALLIYAIFS